MHKVTRHTGRGHPGDNFRRKEASPQPWLSYFNIYKLLEFETVSRDIFTDDNEVIYSTQFLRRLSYFLPHFPLGMKI